MSKNATRSELVSINSEIENIQVIKQDVNPLLNKLNSTGLLKVEIYIESLVQAQEDIL